MPVGYLSKDLNPKIIIKVYIADNDGDWIDFTDRLSVTDDRGIDKAIKISSIKYTVEKTMGSLQTTTQTIVMDNSDGFFNKPFPSTLKKPDGSAAANFSKTLNYNHSVLYKHKIKISILYPDKDTQKASGSYSFEEPFLEYALGVFLIYKNSFDVVNKTVTFTLKALEFPLQKDDAGKVKDGLSWYQNRPVTFLIRELLKLQYRSESGDGLPDTYNTDRVLDTTTVDDALVFSQYGRPPEWDGSIWRNDGLYCRAMEWAEFGGDGGMLYMGCDNELWKWDPTTDTYTSIDTSTLTSTQKIKRMIYTNSKLYVIAWLDECTWDEPISNEALLIYSYNGSGSLVAEKTSSINIWSCLFQLQHSQERNQFDLPAIGYPGQTKGENKTIFFGQEIKLNNNGYAATYPKLYGGNFELWDNLAGNEITINIERSTVYGRCYTALRTIAALGAAELVTNDNIVSMMWSYGTPYQLVSSTYGATQRFAWCSKRTDGASSEERFEIVRWNEVADTIDTVSFTDERVPICMWMKDPVENIIMLSVMLYDDDGTGDANRNINYILKFQQSSLTVVLETDFVTGESGDDLYWTLLEMESLGNSGKGVGCAYNRKTRQFQMVYTTDCESNLYGGMTILKTGSNQFTRFRYDSVSSKIYCYEVGAGRMYSIDGTPTLTVESDGETASLTEFNILSNLAFDTNNGTASIPIIYGITAPHYQIETQSNPPSGDYALFRLTNKVNDRVKIADFGGMDAWPVIKKLAQAVNAIAFFNENGDFVLKSRVVSEGSADYTIGTHSGDIHSIHSLKYDTGEEEIYNYCAIVPYKATYKQPDPNAITLVARDEDEYGTGVDSVPFVAYDIDQRDSLAKTVRAVCIVGGTTEDGNARFKYRIDFEQISVYLTADEISSSTSLDVSSVYGGDNVEGGIHEGDYVLVVDPDSGADIVRLINAAVAMDATAISIASSLGIALNRGDEITILKANRTTTAGGKTIWSDEGVCYLTANMAAVDTASVNSVANVSIGTIVRFGGSGTEYRISAVDRVANQFTVKDLDDTSASVTATSGDIITAWYCPYNDADYPNFLEIGGSKVFLAFRDPEQGTAEVDFTKTFKIGDRILIDCPGLVSEADDSSKQVVMNITSRDKYGRNEFPTTSNEFIHKTLAKEFCKYIVDTYKNPRYKLDLVIPLSPVLKLVTTSGNISLADIVDYNAFPSSAGGVQQCVIRSIDHNLLTGQTKLLLKSVENY